MSKIVDGIVKDLKAAPEKVAAKLKSGNLKKLLLLNMPYLVFAYFFNKLAWLYRVSKESTVLDKVLGILNSMDKAFQNPLPSFQPQDLLIGAAGGIAIRMIVHYRAKNAKKYRHGMEYGSARWSA